MTSAMPKSTEYLELTYSLSAIMVKCDVVSYFCLYVAFCWSHNQVNTIQTAKRFNINSHSVWGS